MASSSGKKSPPSKSRASTARPVAKASVSAPKVKAPEPSAAALRTGQTTGADVLAAEPVEKVTRGVSTQLKKKDLVARVVAALDGKKKGQVKEIVEATLAALGEALQKGESLNLPPFGRARIARQKGEGKTSAMTVKLRGAGEKNAQKGSKQALAEVGEDD